jgi:hypothetical protein
LSNRPFHIVHSFICFAKDQLSLSIDTRPSIGHIKRSENPFGIGAQQKADCKCQNENPADVGGKSLKKDTIARLSHGESTHNQTGDQGHHFPD